MLAVGLWFFFWWWNGHCLRWVLWVELYLLPKDKSKSYPPVLQKGNKGSFIQYGRGLYKKMGLWRQKHQGNTVEDGGRGWSDGSAPREHLGLWLWQQKLGKRQGTHFPAESSEGTNPLTALVLFLSRGIVALPYCIGFCCTRKWISYMYTHPSLLQTSSLHKRVRINSYCLKKKKILLF